MKVLHIIPSVSPLRGGPSEAVLALVKALRDQGTDAEIAATNDNGPGVSGVPLRTRTEFEGVPVWFFDRFSPPFAPIREFAFSSAFAGWLRSHIDHYDLLHVNALFSYTSSFAMTLARRRKMRYLVSPLGLLCHWSLRQSYWKKKVYGALVERSNLAKAAAIHYASEQEQQEASRWTHDARSFVVPHGLHLPVLLPEARRRLRQQLRIPPGEFIILFLSRIHHKKGLDHLIPALGHLKARRFTFALAGTADEHYTQEIGRLLRFEGIADRTLLLGHVAGEFKQLLLQGSDLFVLPSRSENFGIAILEALAAGLPVITTRATPWHELLTHHCGWWIDHGLQPLEIALQEALSLSEEARREMGYRGRELAAHRYSWTGIARQMHSVYLWALGQGTVPDSVTTH